MGAKTAILAFAERDRDPREVLLPGPHADIDTARALAEEFFPGRVAEELGMWELGEAAYPPADAVYAGRFAGFDVVCCRDLMDVAPDALEDLVLRLAAGRRAYLHLMHSVSDALTFACWSEGRLVRRLSVAPDVGIVADDGARFEFELPYWAGDHPVVVDDPSWFDDGDEVPAYPLPFHPLELGEEALNHFFGFYLEGPIAPAAIDSMQVHLAGFTLARAT